MVQPVAALWYANAGFRLVVAMSGAAYMSVG